MNESIHPETDSSSVSLRATHINSKTDNDNDNDNDNNNPGVKHIPSSYRFQFLLRDRTSTPSSFAGSTSPHRRYKAQHNTIQHTTIQNNTIQYNETTLRFLTHGPTRTAFGRRFWVPSAMSRPALSLFRHPRSLLGQRIARPGSGGHRAGSGSALRRWRDGGTSTQTPEAERRKHLQTRCLATTHRRAQRQKQKQRSRGGGGERAGPGRPKRSGGQPHRRRREEPELAIRPPRNYMKKLPKPSEQETAVPPVFLAPTASPFVYVSKAALGDDYDDYGDNNDGDDDDPEPPLDPSTLFSEVYHPSTGAPVPPPLFAQGEFSYFSPKKDLGYEYPKHGAPEVAFLGRSNVGKSSLINALVRKPLCLASRVPGRTRLPHYLGLVPRGGKGPAGGRPDPALVSGFLVDLPGYGYARAPAHASEAWQADTQDLLLQRFHGEGVLKRVFLLVDARRGGEGPSENDRFVLRWLEDAGLPYTVVLTKADRVAVEAVVRQANDFCLRHASFGARGGGAAQSPVVHVTSAAKGWGIHELMLSVEAEFLGGG